MVDILRHPTKGSFREETDEQKNSLILESIIDGFFACDQEWRFVYVNATAEQALGIKRSEVIGKNHWEIYPQTLSTLVEHEYRLAAAGQSRDFEYYCKLRGRWFHNRCFPRKGGGISVYLQDITEHKLTEDALICERNVLQSVMNGAKNSHLVYLDRDFNFVRVNETYAATCGYRPEEMIGKNHFDLYPHAGNEAIFARVRDTGKPFEIHDKPFKFPDQPGRGVTYWDWTLSPVKDEAGEVTGLILSLFETTSRKRAEKALKSSERKFRHLFEKHSATMLLIDPVSLRILDANPAASKFYGYSRSEMQAMKINQINCLPSNELSELAKRIEERKLHYFVTPHRLADGSVRTVEVYLSQIFILNKRIDFVIIHDITERKAAEDSLRRNEARLKAVNDKLLESEQRLRMFIEHAPVALAMFDNEMRYLSASSRWFKDYNVGNRNLTGMLHYEIFPDLPERWKEMHRRGLAGEVLREEADLYQRADGSRKWERWEIRPWYDLAEEIGGIVIFTEDITERKQQEVQLQILNEELEQRVKDRTRELIETRTAADIIAHIPSGLFVYDYVAPDRLYLRDANPEAGRLTGITTEQWAGREFYEIWPAAKELQIKERYLQPFISGEMFETESTEYRDDKLRGAYRVRTFLLPKNRLGVAFEDVTERLRAEQEVVASREQLRQVIDLVPHFIYAKDLDGRFLLANRALAQAFGTTAEELGDKADSEIITDENEIRRLREEDRAVVESGAAKRIEEEVFFDARGEELILSTVKMPFSLSGSNCPAVLSVSVDNTEKVRSEAEKRQLTAQFHQAQKMEAIGTLAGGIAHDFNNILGAIIGYAEMIRDDSLPNSSIRHGINQVLNASLRAKELVGQILAFSRHSGTKPVPLQLGVIINEAVKLLRATLPTTIAVKCELDKNVGLVTVDPTQIHQIIMNLATNAFHAMENGGGTLTFTLRNTTLGEDEPASRTHLPPGEYVLLLVGDTGTGISPAIIDNIFDPYFTTKEKGRGTGLGLATVHGIVQSCGGRIRCESRQGEGTVFTLLFPAATATLPAAAEEAEIAETGTGHILFVDDELMLIEMGRAMLERIGYRVTARTSSLEALTIFQDQPDAFDLVITDLTMPGMTGIDLAHRLLQIKPELPILLCTGYSNLILEEKALTMGIKGFAMKPLAKKELAARIRGILDR